MRGDDRQQTGVFSYISAEQRVPKDHPPRAIREMVDEVLRELSPRFSQIYSKQGRPSIAPEKLLRALLLQVLYSVRSERMLMEQLDYNLLFRWFVGLSMDDPIWDVTVFTKNRDRLLKGDIDSLFFKKVSELARQRGLLSNEHFTVDGTLVDAWAGHKSFKPKDGRKGKPPDDPGNPTVDFRGQRRSNDTHASTTDPDARLFRKSWGTESKLCYAGHLLMDNRHGLAVDARLTTANTRMERDAALEMVRRIRRRRRVTLGGDKGYDVRAFVEALRRLGITPHIARKNTSYSALDGRTLRHEGYRVSQVVRKRVEEIFGWLKTVGLMRKTRHRGLGRVGWMFRFTVAIYNLVRMRNLALAST
ncbi:MAG TPA: IS5 family transposase [Candidatus Krumholzibacteria bacterium]|nr:IS5 family transposase [Candidatus Krumholzibacteria bacterium]